VKLRRQLRQCTCGAKHKGFAVGLLLRAAEKGILAALKECPEDDEDVTQTAGNEITALHWAAFHGFADMIGVLLQKGAVLDAPSNNE
jgi:ankyrin repeat protein